MLDRGNSHVFFKVGRKSPSENKFTAFATFFIPFFHVFFRHASEFPRWETSVFAEICLQTSRKYPFVNTSGNKNVGNARLIWATRVRNRQYGFTPMPYHGVLSTLDVSTCQSQISSCNTCKLGGWTSLSWRLS